MRGSELCREEAVCTGPGIVLSLLISFLSEPGLGGGACSAAAAGTAFLFGARMGKSAQPLSAGCSCLCC